jgi:hypothetical protein
MTQHPDFLVGHITMPPPSDVSEPADRAFNTSDVCDVLLTATNLGARDIAACACVNKTMADAASKAWPALRARSLPAAVEGSSAVATLRAFKFAERSAALTPKPQTERRLLGDEPADFDVYESRFVVCLRSPDGAPLLSQTFKLSAALKQPFGYQRLKDYELFEPYAEPAVAALCSSGAFTASLFVQLPNGAGGTRVACILNSRAPQLEVSCEDIDSEPEGERNSRRRESPSAEDVRDEWLRGHAKRLFSANDDGRVLAFSNAAEADSDRLEHSVPEDMRTSYEDCVPVHIWFAVLVHLSSTGKEPTLHLVSTVLDFDWKDGLWLSRMSEGHLEQPMQYRLQWQDC